MQLSRCLQELGPIDLVRSTSERSLRSEEWAGENRALHGGDRSALKRCHLLPWHSYLHATNSLARRGVGAGHRGAAHRGLALEGSPGQSPPQAPTPQVARFAAGVCTGARAREREAASSARCHLAPCSSKRPVLSLRALQD